MYLGQEHWAYKWAFHLSVSPPQYLYKDGVFGVFLLIIMSFRPKSDTQLLQFEYPEDACDSTGMLNALNGILELGVNVLDDELDGSLLNRFIPLN